MDKRIGVVGIVIEDENGIDDVNATLHNYREIIAGRMGLPYRERGCSVISLIVDADSDKISALTGTLGKIKGVSVKSAIQKTSK